jgi:hypothetical protein
MNLIVSELAAFRRYVSREFYFVMNDLITNYGWRQIETFKLWNYPGTLKRALLDVFGEVPESILFWEGYEFLNARAAQIHQLDCRKFILADDLHWWNVQMRQRKLAGFALCETVLSSCAYLWTKFYPELSGAKRVVWIPHSAGPDFIVDYNQHPENSIFLSGALSNHYPLRQQMMELHAQGAYPIIYHRHPGYHCHYDHERNENVGRGYAEKINKYRAGFTDSLIYGYVVAKCFEIPATGALLLADGAVSGPLKELGFTENEHYLPVSKENLEETIRYVLDESNHEELDQVRRRGQELVWEKHKTSDRAWQINEACAD